MVEVRSRSDRRSEKRQSFFFIAFIMTVAIVCFASGFMVGRNTAPKTVQPVAAEAGQRKPIAAQPGTETTDAEKKPENLTFYEALPKGEQPPMGSGINLPPQEKVQASEAEKTAAAPAPMDKKPVPEKVFETAKSTTPAPAPKPSAPKEDLSNAKYLLQVASFPQPDEAGKLLGKLTQGGYNVFVQQADLGSKGIWYRVYVGPVVGQASAEAMKTKLERDFKLKPWVQKQ